MNWLGSILYGIISGLTEFLPVSSRAHQQIFMQFCGQSVRDPVRDLFVHVALLLAVWICIRPMSEQIRRNRSARRKRDQAILHDTRAVSDYRLVKNAVLPMLIVFMILRYILPQAQSLLLCAAGLVINGIIMFIPERLIRSNKDSRSMSSLDSVAVGVGAALSAFSGISRVGCVAAIASMRGASRRNAFNWALMLSLPALICWIVMDIVQLFSGVVYPFWTNFFHYILSFLSAFGFGYISIMIVRSLPDRPGFAGFTFYSWGAALISFFLYLTVI